MVLDIPRMFLAFVSLTLRTMCKPESVAAKEEGRYEHRPLTRTVTRDIQYSIS